MTSSLEALVFDSLALNAASGGWQLEQFTVAPPSKRLQRLSSADADSDVLAEAATHDLRTATARIRWEGGSDMDDALGAIQTLTSLLQRAEEREGGSPLVWTPANSTHTGTLYVQSGEITDLPIEQDGDGSGWLLDIPKPVITVRFDCFPFIHGAEYTAATLSSTSDRIASMEVSDVPGDVPGLGRLVITDTGTQDRGHVEIGGDRYGYDYASPSDLDLTAASDLTALAGTLSGSYIGLTAGTTAIGVCEAQNLPHTGPHNVRAVVERTDATATIRVRAAVQTVDGQWTYTSWRTLPSSIGTYDVLLGDVTFPAVERGNQRSTLRIEATASTAAVVRIYRINPIPTEVVYAVARQKVGGTPSSYDGFDTFDQTAGNLDAPKAANIGGNWSEANRTGANGLQVETTGHTAQRTTVSDASLDGGGCYAYLGSSVAACSVAATVKFSAVPSLGTAYFGLLARYVDTNNWAALVLAPATDLLGSSLSVVTKVSGTLHVLSSLQSSFFGVASYAHSLRLEIDASGTYRAYWEGMLQLSGADPDFATGGTLASGKRGLYDAYTSATANTRNYDDYQALAAPPVNCPLFSGRSCEIAHGHAIREAAAGTNWAPMARYRGRRLYIPPAGPAGLRTRLVLKDRRTDVDGGVADSADTARSAELYVTPRYLVVP